jgi:hypothetical protein
MRCSSNFLVLTAAVVVACGTAAAQMPNYKNVGRTPTQEEIRAWDISIGPEGKELPAGSGTAKQGANIFARKCAFCHGKSGVEGPAKNLSDETRIVPVATTVWDYIHRAMPMDKEGSLSADEVYALTALLLFRGGIIQENAVMDAKSLPQVQMPNRNGFFPRQREWKPGVPRPPYGAYP